MGFLRGTFVLLFPVSLSLLGLVLAFITFFSSYEHAGALKDIHFMTIDFSKIDIGGVSVSQLTKTSNTASAFGIGANGFCLGTSPSSMAKCVTPTEPFYFSFSLLLDLVGLSSLMSQLPTELRNYDTVLKDVTYGIWGAFVATICLSFLQLLFGIFAIFTDRVIGLVELLAGLAIAAAIIGSGMATGLYSVLVSKINGASGVTGSPASIGRSGLGLAWATVAALLLAEIFYVLSGCCMSRRRKYIEVPDQKPFFV